MYKTSAHDCGFCGDPSTGWNYTGGRIHGYQVPVQMNCFVNMICVYTTRISYFLQVFHIHSTVSVMAHDSVVQLHNASHAGFQMVNSPCEREQKGLEASAEKGTIENNAVSLTCMVPNMISVTQQQKANRKASG